MFAPPPLIVGQTVRKIVRRLLTQVDIRVGRAATVARARKEVCTVVVDMMIRVVIDTGRGAVSSGSGGSSNSGGGSGGRNHRSSVEKTRC